MKSTTQGLEDKVEEILRVEAKLSMVVYTCNSSTLEVTQADCCEFEATWTP